MTAQLTYQRQPGTHELAARAGLQLYPCPLHALLTESGCNTNRARLRAAVKARDEIAMISVRECRGCPGVLALARGQRPRTSKARGDVLTAVQAAAMLGWVDASAATTKLHAAGVKPVSFTKGNTPINRARRNLYAREDVERLVAERSERIERSHLSGSKISVRREREAARVRAIATLKANEMLSDEVRQLLGDRASASRGIATIMIRAGVKPLRKIPWKHAAGGTRYVFARDAVIAYVERRRLGARRSGAGG